MNVKTHKELVFVTGLSGAGLSSVLKTLEDYGFEAFDNFPLTLVPALIEDQEANAKIAIGIDTRTRNFDPHAIISEAQNREAKILFISCDDAALYTRFAETRRRHPLAKDKPISIGIEKERTLLTPLQDAAYLTIDSTHLSIHDIRHILEGHFGHQAADNLTITLMSFGFKNGIPREADIVMDMRFLKNPHWEPDLKPKTGKDSEIGEFIKADPDFEEFLEHFQTMLTPLLPRYIKGGRSYLTIAIGCTGGRHRSVYTVERLSEWLNSTNTHVHTEHRDLK